MKRTFLLGSLFLRVSTVYAGATHGDLVMEGRRRNEEAYERSLEMTGWKSAETHQEEKANSIRNNEKNSKASKSKSS